jgi:ribosomal protein S18 acetylase RimI-like enzyme
VDDKIIGVTGYRAIVATDASYWLNWTYLEPDFQGKGFGKKMVLELLDKLRALDARKIFVKVSDYNDPEDGKIYENAMKLYKSIGFEEEIVNKGFYDEDENQHILGLYLQEQSESEEEVEVAEEKPDIQFTGLYEISETDGAYSFSWTVEKSKKLFGKRNFSTQDLIIGLESVKNQGGRKIFLTFPSNLPLIHKPLQDSGFTYVGRLADYYETGIHEYHFDHDLEDLAQTS